MRNEKQGSVPSEWETFKKSVQWRDITLNLLIPKMIFYISMNKPWLLTGASGKAKKDLNTEHNHCLYFT